MNTSALLPRPGACLGPYPERRETAALPRDLLIGAWRGWLHAPGLPSRSRRLRFLNAVHGHLQRLTGIEPALLQAQARRTRTQLTAKGFGDEPVSRAFGIVSAALQHTHGVTPYDTQLLAGWWMLERRLAEMHTGEGKTLAIALTAMTAALAGIPVHVVTANDYLVERDALGFEPTAQLLGLRIGHVTSAMTPAQRRQAYQADITYVTGKELVFDYLRDRPQADAACAWGAPGERLLRGLCMAIVDEADSVLLDEARMPLVLAQTRSQADEAAFHRQALFLSAQLRVNADYTLNPQRLSVELSYQGRRQAKALGEKVGGAWTSAFVREETLCLALAAKHLYQRDRHYLVRDGKVLIIDETTGRSAPGRQWSRGLHQMIEAKENCALTAQGATSAQTTFQRFFPRYLRLSGISGTLAEARHELLAIYGLPIAQVPLRAPSRRTDAGAQVFASTQALWTHVARRATDLRGTGRPCLIGTGSVAESQALSEHLQQAGLPHTVLNASQDADEAGVVARAGEPGAITIATNMAGRGTDIALSEATLAAGGLHVISCQVNRSARIDRQLRGRCARQGAPGSFEQAIALDNAALPEGMNLRLMRAMAPLLGGQPAATWSRLARPALQRMQEACEGQERYARWQSLQADLHLDRMLALTGPRE